MNALVKALARSRLFKGDLDLHLVRGSMVLVFLLFGYQKWFEYEAQTLIPFIRNGPLIWWMYPAFGIRGASWFLGASEWLFAALLFWGFWNKKAGILGALGCAFAMIGTVTIIPFMPDGWDPAAGFPAMKGSGFPDEGRGPSRRLLLPAEAGRGERCTFRGRTAPAAWSR
jgi:uncharacterized membrane protein YkgB